MKTFLVLLLLASGMGTSFAGDKIWTGLILGVNNRPPVPPETQIANIATDLTQVFGYNTYYLLGKKSQSISVGNETWAIPGKEFSAHVVCLGREKNVYRLQVQLFRGKEMLMDSKVNLARGAPLLVAGPSWGDGKVIVALRIP